MRASDQTRKFLIASIPLIIGLLASAVWAFNLFGLQNPAFQARFDLSWLFALLGIAISAVWLCGLVLQRREEIEHNKALAMQEEAHAQQNREFLRRLDHELKNPLTIIRLGILNLMDGGELGDGQKASAERINQQAERLRQLVLDLRRLTELESDAIETAPVDLVDVLEESVALAEDALETERKVNLTIQTTPWPLSTIPGDRELLILALRNLIDNALKYSNQEDRVDVRALDDGEAITIEIADNGMGIPDGEIGYIFEQLYRGDQARIKPGSGLGLPMVERIIQLHNGRVEVRSRNQTGSVFAVTLPIHPTV